MNKYIIVRFDGAYVMRPGSERSFTKDLKNARRFATREAAAKECCCDEHVSTVEEELGPS